MFSFLSRLFSRKPQYCESLKRFPQQLVRDLPITPEIERALEIVGKSGPNRRRRAMEQTVETFKIHYHYDGHCIAVTDTPAGLSVLAGTLEDAGELVRNITDEERPYVVIMVAGEWDYEPSREHATDETQDSSQRLDTDGGQMPTPRIENGSPDEVGLPASDVRP